MFAFGQDGSETWPFQRTQVRPIQHGKGSRVQRSLARPAATPALGMTAFPYLEGQERVQAVLDYTDDSNFAKWVHSLGGRYSVNGIRGVKVKSGWGVLKSIERECPPNHFRQPDLHLRTIGLPRDMNVKLLRLIGQDYKEVGLVTAISLPVSRM